MKFFRVIFNEMKKEMLIALSYKTQWIGELISLIIFFLFLSKISNQILPSIFSYCLWFYSILIIGDVSGKITSEMRIGTLEQMFLSSFPLLVLLWAKIVASIAKCTLLMLCLLFLLFIYGNIELSGLFNPFFFFALLLITPGVFGLSMLIGGLTLFIKDAMWIVNIVNNSILFLGGIFLSIELFPDWIKKISFTIPTTKAISIIHLQNVNLVDWIYLGLLSLTYCIIGGFFFFLCTKKAKLKGLLGYY